MARRPLAHLLLRHGYAELRRAALVRGAHRRTARRIAGAQALVALAAALLGGEGALAQAEPLFLNPNHPFGLQELGADPVRLAFGDLDGDGDLDVLASSFGTPSFFPNEGTRRRPIFGAPVPTPFGIPELDTYATLALADLEGDGDLDLLVGKSTGATTLFPNTGTETAPAFGAETTLFGLTSVSAYAAPAVADLDGDGDLDLVVGDADGRLTLFVNTAGVGGAGFTTGVIDPLGLGDFSSFAAPALADLDGDGDLDAYVGQAEGTVIVSENTGATTAPAFSGAGGPFPPGFDALVNGRAAPAFADLDDDGDLDALVADASGLTAYFENSGNRLAPAFRHASRPFGLATGSQSTPAFGDLDGDGDLDGLFGTFAATLSVFPNTGTRSSPLFGDFVSGGFYGLTVFSPAASLSPALGDLDGDGDLDVLVGNDAYGGELFLFRNTGSATAPAFDLAEPDPFCAGSLGTRPSPDFVDFGDDGDLDLAIVYEDGRIDYCENTGTATAPAFAAPETTPFGLPVVATPPHFAFGDLQGNGIVDALYGDDEGNLNVVFNSGTNATPIFVAFDGTSFGLPPIGSDVNPALADLDGDGDPDVVSVSQFGETLVTFVENLSERWLCSPAPRALCDEFPGGSLTIDERKPGKEKLVLSLTRGPELAPAELGAPLEAGGNAYALCVYDQSGARVANLEVERAGETCGAKPCWKRTAKGFAYADKAAAQADGVTSLVLKSGPAGRSKVTAAASNNTAKGRTALRTGLAPLLADATLVTVQVATDGGECLSADLDEIRKQTPTLFKAR